MFRLRVDGVRAACSADRAEAPRVRPWRRLDPVATRYDKLAVRYEATVHIAAINEWLPHL